MISAASNWLWDNNMGAQPAAVVFKYSDGTWRSQTKVKTFRVSAATGATVDQVIQIICGLNPDWTMTTKWWSINNRSTFISTKSNTWRRFHLNLPTETISAACVRAFQNPDIQIRRMLEASEADQREDVSDEGSSVCLRHFRPEQSVIDHRQAIDHVCSPGKHKSRLLKREKVWGTRISRGTQRTL